MILDETHNLTGLWPCLAHLVAPWLMPEMWFGHLKWILIVLTSINLYWKYSCIHSNIARITSCRRPIFPVIMKPGNGQFCDQPPSVVPFPIIVCHTGICTDLWHLITNFSSLSHALPPTQHFEDHLIYTKLFVSLVSYFCSWNPKVPLLNSLFGIITWGNHHWSW